MMKDRAIGRRTLAAIGFTTEKGRKQVCIHLDPLIFEELKMRAVKAGRSIRAQIRDYIEMGLSVDQDMDADASPAPVEQVREG